MKRSKLQHTLRGCGKLPHLGYHPNLAFILGFPLIGFIAGLEHDAMAPALIAGLILIVFGPIFLKAAYHRSVQSDEIEAVCQEMEKKKQNGPIGNH